MADPRTQVLSIFLLKADVNKPKDALNGKRTVARQVFKLGKGVPVELYTRQNSAARPQWSKFFEDTPADLSGLSTRSAAAILFVPRRKRLFAVVFGGGRHDLVPGCWEESFGLRVTVNSIDETKIRSIDSKTFESIARHTRTQTSNEGEAFNFGLDLDRDLLRALTGVPRDARHGVRLAGLDALVATVRMEIDELPALLDAYLLQFQSDTYKRHFSWIDNVAEVRDPKRFQAANEQLEKLLQTWTPSSGEKIWLVPPDVIAWSEAGEFTYGETFANPYADLHLREFMASVRDQRGLTVDALKKRKIVLWDLDGDQPRHTWSTFACLYAELEIDGETYLLTAGKWYRIDRNFARAVKKDVEKLVDDSVVLPEYRDRNEGDYNLRVSKTSTDYALMDKDNVMFGGARSRIEVCDLFSISRDMIHVKRYGGSAPLSHLFAQGANAAQLWMEDDPAFREKVTQKLPLSHRPVKPSARPERDEYRIVYGIVSQSKKPIDGSLPFFSCLTLRNVARQIKSYGMRVCLVKIETSA